MAGILGGIKALLSGGDLIKDGLDFINDRWPPNMSEEQKEQMRQLWADTQHRNNMQLLNQASEDERIFNERTIQLEGTAGDLKSIPFLGPIIIFLRGAFRPLFSYFTLYMDWIYFSTATERVLDADGLLVRVVATWTQQQETLLLVMNLLVLIFFFGERAMKNVMPIILRVFGVRADMKAAENGKQ